MIRVDIFGVKDAYLSDVARTAVVGKPAREQEEIWRHILELRANALDRIKPRCTTERRDKKDCARQNLKSTADKKETLSHDSAENRHRDDDLHHPYELSQRQFPRQTE